MTKVKTISVIIITAVVCNIVMLYFKMYTISIVMGVLIILLCLIWYRMLGEALIIHIIMKNGRKMDYSKIIDLYGHKADSVLKKMEKKRIIEISGKEVFLKEGK